MQNATSKFSIRYKFLAVISGILLFCVTTYLVMATWVFKKDKTELVFEYNRSNVNNVASDLESLFSSIRDKINTVAYFLGEKSEQQKLVLDQLLNDKNQIVYVGVSKNFNSVENQMYLNQSYVQTYALEPEFFEKQLLEKKSIPFDKISKRGEVIWNATIQDGPPVIGYGKLVTLVDPRGIPYDQFAIVSFVKADKIISALTRSDLNEVFVVSEEGELLAHEDPKLMARAQPGTRYSDPAVEKAFSFEQIKTSVMEYTDPNRVKFLGAFSKALNNKLTVISKVSSIKAFEVVDRFVFRSLIFACIVITAAFIAAIVFSQSLTQPLAKLVGAMEKVSLGFLDQKIDIKTDDEIAVLAKSFNTMINDLRVSRKELIEINRDLEKKVKQRTKQLEEQNHAVKQAQEALLRTTRLAAVGEIAGQAAHEVLNPLTSIVSRVQRVQDRLKNQIEGELQLMGDITSSWESDYQTGGFDKLVEVWKSPSEIHPGQSLWDEDLGNIRTVKNKLHSVMDHFVSDTEFLLKESYRIDRIVQNMRSLNAVKGEKQQTSLNQVILECRNIMADLADQMDIPLNADLIANQDLVLIDVDEFVQALTNMIRNSLQAVKQKRAQQTTNVEASRDFIRLRSVEEGDHVVVYVEDTGVGISKENQAKLFETQFSTKPVEEGTGLGLSISRRFIREFGGDIILHHTSPEKGTVFKIVLPKFSSLHGRTA